MHERLYTFAQEDTPVEIVTLSIAAEGVFPPPKLEELASGGARRMRSPRIRRCASKAVRSDARSTSARVWQPAREIYGPAIVTQLDSTTLLLPGHAADGRPFRQPRRNRARLTGGRGYCSAVMPAALTISR